MCNIKRRFPHGYMLWTTVGLANGCQETHYSSLVETRCVTAWRLEDRMLQLWCSQCHPTSGTITRIDSQRIIQLTEGVLADLQCQLRIAGVLIGFQQSAVRCRHDMHDRYFSLMPSGTLQIHSACAYKHASAGVQLLVFFAGSMLASRLPLELIFGQRAAWSWRLCPAPDPPLTFGQGKSRNRARHTTKICAYITLSALQ